MAIRLTFPLILLSVALALPAAPAQAQQVGLSSGQVPPSLPAAPASLPGASFSFDQLPELIVRCSAHDSPGLKAACFQELSAAVQDRTRFMSLRNQFAWSSNISGDGQSRSITVAVAAVEATSSASSNLEKSGFFLSASCRGGYISVYVAFPAPVDAILAPPLSQDRSKPSRALPVQVSLHGNIRNFIMFPSESGRAVGLWSSVEAKDFLEFILHNDALGFSFALRNDKAMSLNFDTRGIDEATRPVLDACRAGPGPVK